MGHAEYLRVPGHLSQLFRHLLGRAAGNAGIHLVEYQRGNGLLPRQHVFQGQHDPGQFTAGGDLSDGPQVLSCVGGHQEPDHVTAVGGRLFFREFDSKANFVHVQIP